MARKYSTSAVSQAIELLENRGYDIVTVQEGTLGWGHVIALSPDDKHYNVEIQEVYLNEWSSGHTIRNFDKISARIMKLLENVGYVA